MSDPKAWDGFPPHSDQSGWHWLSWAQWGELEPIPFRWDAADQTWETHDDQGGPHPMGQCFRYVAECPLSIEPNTKTEWFVNTYDAGEVVVLSRGIRATVEMRGGGPGGSVLYVATLGGAVLGKFPSQGEAKQHLLTAGKAELENAIRALAEFGRSAQKQFQ